MSGFRLGSGSLRKLEGVHPALVDWVHSLINITPVDFTVFEGVRTREKQQRYVDSGVSRTLDSRHLIQLDTGYGMAVDLVVFDRGRLWWNLPDGQLHPGYRELAQAGWEARKESGLVLRHGADFNFTGKQDGQLIDWPHWEMPKPEYWDAAIRAIDLYYS